LLDLLECGGWEETAYPKGLKPLFVAGLERPKAEALGYLEATAKVTATAKITAKATAKAKAKCGGLSTAQFTMRL
jgi:hypothetical protein